MSNLQNYAVSYTIDVEASKGVKQVNAFADSVARLTSARTNLDGAVSNIKKMMNDIDKAFRTRSGKKRDYSYKFNIDTNQTEKKLERVKVLLTEIGQMTKGINLVLHTGQPLNSKALINEKTAKQTAESFAGAQQRITKNIGKINSALIHLEKGKQLNINTDAAKQRLNEVLGLINKVNATATKGASLRLDTKGLNRGKFKYAPYNPHSFAMSDKAQQKLQEKLFSAQQLGKQRLLQQEQEAAAKAQRKTASDAVRRLEKEQELFRKQQESIRKKTLADQQRREKEEQRKQQQNAANIVRQAQRQSMIDTSKKRAAINRMQYSKAPSFRNMPLAYMFNAYMGYSLMKSELTKAVEYSNIMETAHSILKVADDDLVSFEYRFDRMAKYVRQIGVETKFTAIEVAGAVKYLSMAGMGIETINESIRPITNLALIGDNDISQIADLATNIMAGYDIKSTSMSSVADILASTVSRSNVNIIEMAESFKMSAGYLKMAGVDFTESAAAIGILGNAGIKGTMAGTSLRAMSTRFAKPTKEAQKTMDRLGIRFTEYKDIYGKPVEQLRPLADIFTELKNKGATMADMQAIFGKIGGNAAMMFLKNSDKLRELTAHNRASQGISGELAKVKQDTTKGLWHQVTSQFSESFMQAFELVEPQIKSVLKSFLDKFSAPDFARGLASIVNALLDLFSVISNIATWFTKNYNWIEPLLFSGIVATRLFKIAGALTNIGVAFGFIGKQSAAASGIQMITGLAGFGGVKGMNMANKRALVSTLSAAGVSGKGAMTKALMQGGMAGGANALLTRGAASGLFASQVATGNGIIGAGASLSALGAGAVAATAGVATLVGAMGWLAYKTWKVKEVKDAVLEEIEANRKYRYPSIDALYSSLADTYEMALNAKKAVDDLTANKTIEEASGHKIGAFTGNWWVSVMSQLGAGMSSRNGNIQKQDTYSFQDAYQHDAKDALITLAKKDSQSRINSAFAELGKFTTAWEVAAFMNNIQAKFGQNESKLDKSLWTTDANGIISYKKGIENLKEAEAYKTWHYTNYHNTVTVPEIQRAATVYQKAIGSYEGARELMIEGKFDFNELHKRGFQLNKRGEWVQKPLGKDATDNDRSNHLADRMAIHDLLVKFTSSLRNTLGGSSEAAENILKKAGFSPDLYSNEPGFNDTQPFNANGITSTSNQYGDEDDGKAGGNYSGTGKLSSAAPKQVIVNISNLLSIETIDLMKSKEGQTEEIQNLKEQMAQALIDVVHDFDASWNG